MKSFKLIVVFAALLVLNTEQIKAAKYKGSDEGGSNKSSGIQGIAANCAPPSGFTDMSINNIRTRIHTGGDMWWDLQGRAMYEVPKNSGQNSMFSGSLWLGGQDISGQLKVAALRYRDGIDFWTGPLSTVDAEIDPETCSEFDQHFVTSRMQVERFVGWFQAGLEDEANGTSTQQENFPGYSISDTLFDWPAHGDISKDQDYFLAPFVDVNGDGFYNPIDGDYPAYDLQGEADCSKRIANIYGDQNFWWVFNDNGNIHTESGSIAIGMEIRAQAFGFTTNDEVNNMTFYNYELVNRATFTLTNTYFGQWADADVGNYQNDYVGCDVERGLGYCYAATMPDEDFGGAKGYGNVPTAIGIDFFQGPFQDPDGLDNEVGIDHNEALNGVGYGDGIPDNERFGMRRFLYHNNTGGALGDPSTGVGYYNLLRGRWKQGETMVYGGTGHPTDPSSMNEVYADFMFPGSTDPLGWGVTNAATGENGIQLSEIGEWTEITAGNLPQDRRFIQSAGPFTLTPGAVNNITVGICWAQGKSNGSPFSAVQELLVADDKTQAMFDNCFKVLNGPDAPDLVIKEYDRELILLIANSQISNNFQELYEEVDPFMAARDSVDTNNDGTPDVVLTPEEKEEFRTYRFQGYQIYQLKDNTVGPDEVKDPNKARLVAQCDVKDGVAQIVNHRFDRNLNGNIAEEQVDGKDEGISHSFRITEDRFAQGDGKLVNHKQYYFMAIAYAYNAHGEDFGNLKHLPDLYDPTDPATFEAQKIPYISSRKAATGPIRTMTGIPHLTDPKDGGTKLNAKYGDEVELTRIEGVGNSGRALMLKQETINEIMSGPPWRVLHPTYQSGSGPVQIKVVDPLNIPADDFVFQLIDTIPDFGDLSNASWAIYKKDGQSPGDTLYSHQTIRVKGEQVLLNWGLSVSIEQAKAPGNIVANNGFISGTISFADNSKNWLTGISNADGFSPRNWIRSGTSQAGPDDPPEQADYDDYLGVDDDQVYESVLGGTWAPFRLAAKLHDGPKPHDATAESPLEHLINVDIIITPDKDKWTRCPVIETQDDDVKAEEQIEKGFPRASLSVDRDGNTMDTTGWGNMTYAQLKDTLATLNMLGSDNPDDPDYIAPLGMGWFPGYAIDVETGERLNMAFGEDSWLKAENGSDMLWNPTSNITGDPHILGALENWRLAGKHFIYVFRNNVVEDLSAVAKPEDRMPAYDAGKFMYGKLSDDANPDMRTVYRACAWVGYPRLANEQELLSTEVSIRLRVASHFRGYGTGELLSPADGLVVGEKYFVHQGPIRHPAGKSAYRRGSFFTALDETFSTVDDDDKDNVYSSVNGGMPIYSFSTHDLAPTKDSLGLAQKALDLIKVVPNPYYAHSAYETHRLDNRVKITNLPRECNISIYTVNGTLVRKFKKDDPTITSMDWDLKNHARVPIASGIYIIHVDVPDVGEKVLKWFGVMRQIDMDNF